jgi:hypothetical protein
MRRVSAYSIVVNRHPVAPGRVVVHPLCSVQHDGRLVQCLSTARTPRDTGDPVASDLLGLKLCGQVRDKQLESWSNLGGVHWPGSAGLAARRYWVGAFATVENAAVLEGRLAVTGNAVERGLFVAPGSTAIIGTCRASG